MSTAGGIQAALDQINAEAWRNKRNPVKAAMSWEPAADGDGLTMTATWGDGYTVSGYSPLGMRDIRASEEAERPKLCLV